MGPDNGPDSDEKTASMHEIEVDQLEIELKSDVFLQDSAKIRSKYSRRTIGDQIDEMAIPVEKRTISKIVESKELGQKTTQSR